MHLGLSVTRFGEIRHLSKTLQVLSKILTACFLLGKMMTLYWQIWYIIGLIFIVANCQILKII